MSEEDKKLILELENKVNFLENQLNNVLITVKSIINNNEEEAKKSLNDYKESAELELFKKLVEKSFFNISAKETNDKTSVFLKIIIESMPFPVFIKDEDGTYIMINALEAKLFGKKESEIIGKHDSEFIKNKEEIEIIEKTDKEVLTSNKSIELPNQSFSLRNGRSYIFKTHKIPITNPITGRPNILGFSIDQTDTVNLNKLKNIVTMYNPYM